MFRLKLYNIEIKMNKEKIIYLMKLEFFQLYKVKLFPKTLFKLFCLFV